MLMSNFVNITAHIIPCVPYVGMVQPLDGAKVQSQKFLTLANVVTEEEVIMYLFTEAGL